MIFCDHINVGKWPPVFNQGLDGKILANLVTITGCSSKCVLSSLLCVGLSARPRHPEPTHQLICCHCLQRSQSINISSILRHPWWIRDSLNVHSIGSREAFSWQRWVKVRDSFFCREQEETEGPEMTVPIPSLSPAQELDGGAIMSLWVLALGASPGTERCLNTPPGRWVAPQQQNLGRYW